MQIKRTGIVLSPNSRRVVLRPFIPFPEDRKLRIIAHVSTLPEEEVDRLVAQVLDEFHGRHQRPRDFLISRFESARDKLLTDAPLTENRRLLIGAYLTQEYAVESAALFNPSIVQHPDQSGLSAGARRFVLSLRATGEGHVSSITFRSGVIDALGAISTDEPTRFATPPDAIADSSYDKPLFLRKLNELGLAGAFTSHVMSRLEDEFSVEQLESALQLTIRENRTRHHEFAAVFDGIVTLAKSNYEVVYLPSTRLSERLIFPFSPTESAGIEDARFVRFHDEDGAVTYYATYSAYDGKVVLPQLLETEDFLRFKMHTLNGPAVANKGLALFPRRINGRYAMLSRQDGENLFLMDSDNLYFWHTKQFIAKPTFPWEFVQIGSCGSPIETDAGWLVLTSPRETRRERT